MAKGRMLTVQVAPAIPRRRGSRTIYTGTRVTFSDGCVVTLLARGLSKDEAVRQAGRIRDEGGCERRK